MLLDRIHESDPCQADPMRRFLWPHTALRPYIAHYTLFWPRPREVDKPFTVIPDASGCLVFTFTPGEITGAFMGASTKAQAVSNDALPRLFVEFLPGGARRLLSLPHIELADRKLPLDELLPLLNEAILQHIERANGIPELHEALDGLFLRLLERRPSDHPIFPALQSLRRTRGFLPTIGEFASSVCYSERHLSRIASDQLGLGLKAYLRVLRVNRALRDLKATGLPGALSHGYFDQAHFIHDFKDICGATPRALLRNKSDFYNEPYKF